MNKELLENVLAELDNLEQVLEGNNQEAYDIIKKIRGDIESELFNNN